MSLRFSNGPTRSKNLEGVINRLYKRVIIFYHESCQDGEVANICAIQGLRKLGCELEIRSIGRSYQKDFSVLDEDGVLMADISWALIFYVDFAPMPDELALVSQKNMVVVLDHHDTAKKAHGITSVNPITIINCLESGLVIGRMLVIDNDRSGAGITWDFFNPGISRPELVKYVEDRDLWKFKFKGSRELALFIQNNRPETWVKFFNRFNNNKLYRTRVLRESKTYYNEVQELLAELSALSELFEVNDLVSYRLIESSVHHSDVANRILQDNPSLSFAVVMVNKGSGKYKLSFRSEDSRMSVSALCERFGGGGHRNAAGLNLELCGLETIEGKILELVKIYLEGGK